MDSQENPHPPQPTQRCFYLFSILGLLLAVSFTFTSILFPGAIFDRFLTFLLFPGMPLKNSYPNPNPNPSPCVLWMAPFLSGGGYSSEAWSYILALQANNQNPSFRIKIIHHGDQEVLEFWEGLPNEMKMLAFELHQADCAVDNTIVVCHSEPGAWFPPLFQTFPCPPIGYGYYRSIIGRTMFETDRLSPQHVERCNQMDFVWVPTDFHVSTFVESGVDPSKVVKIIQPVDVEFFDPLKYDNSMDLSYIGTLVLGSAKRKPKFGFLSIFKWEYRKGWDVLLQAYLKEFTMEDGVALYLLTNPYHTNRDFSDKIVEFVEDSDLVKPRDGWAPIYVIDHHIPQIDLPKIYKAADAFVLPSRGEGWGRPLVEAMAMSLPVITTNWSGPTEYITEENSYPLPVDYMSEVLEGPFEGHLWAEPSVDELQVLMRRVMSSPEEAKAKGRRARDDMISRFSPEIVAGILTGHIEQILNRTSKRLAF